MGEVLEQETARTRELDRVERQIKKVVNDLKEGIPAAVVKDELIARCVR